MTDKLEALKDLASEMVIKFNHWSKCAALTSESTSALHSQTLSKTAQLITDLTEALERGAKNEHALGGLLDEMTRRRDSQANRANSAEQREEHLKADAAVMGQRIANQAELAEQLGKALDGANKTAQGWKERAKTAEQRLQQPIKLPPRINHISLCSPLEVEDMWIHRLIHAAKEAGFKVEGA